MSKRKVPTHYTAHGAIDSHAHLGPNEFGDELPNVIERAFSHGLSAIVCVAADKTPESYSRILRVVQGDPRLFLTAGVHPHYASNWDQLWPMVQSTLQMPRTVGLGEYGLDFHYDWSPRSVQKDVMKHQLEHGLTHDLPSALHIRDAYDEALEILDQFGRRHLGVIHCFSAGPAEVREFLDRGFYISLPGIITFKKSDTLREAALQVPVDRLLVETDTPYLAPVPFRGKRNEPAFVSFVIESLAALRGIEPAALALQTRDNTLQLYGFELPQAENSE